MIATPQILQAKAQEAAVIHLTIPRADMMKQFGPAVGELMAALAAQGVQPAGAVFANYLKMTPDIFEFELGVKVSAPVKAAQGNSMSTQMPGGREKFEIGGLMDGRDR